MKLNDSIDMKGRLTIQIKDKTGNIVQECAADNDIVMSGRELVALMFVNKGGAPISHIAVGTGTAAVTPASDVKLNVELFRKEIKTITPSTDILKKGDRVSVIVSTDLELEDAIGALTEAAIFNALDPATSTMYNRVVFPPVNKTTDFKLTLVWEILF